jgi:adenine-specific DNA-methyltransferase
MSSVREKLTYSPYPPVSCKVFTPPRLATAMIGALSPEPKRSWLEPGCGSGVFLNALSQSGVSRSQIWAVDLDTCPSECDELGKVTRGVDFLNWAKSRRRRFDCIIGNPPYLPIASLIEPFRSEAANVLDSRGISVGLRSNTWYAFLHASLKLLEDGGNLAFVLPSACEYADYCRPGREAITGLFRRVDLIRSKRPLFEHVQEGSVILLCREKGKKGGYFRRHLVEDVEGAIERLQSLNERQARLCPIATTTPCSSGVRFGDVASVRLGGVTGDANYFVFNESRRRELSLPISALKPVITKTWQIYNAEVSELGWSKLKGADARVWLFYPKGSSLKHEAVRRYLRLKSKDGGCNRSAFKIRNRDPWYLTPLPENPDGFISGMSPYGIWICLNEKPRLNAINTLYTVSFSHEYSRRERYAWALSLLTSQAAKSFSRLTRVYADGLRKIEPGPLSEVIIPNPPKIVDAVTRYRMSLKHLLCGDFLASRRIADQAIAGD